MQTGILIRIGLWFSYSIWTPIKLGWHSLPQLRGITRKRPICVTVNHLNPIFHAIWLTESHWTVDIQEKDTASKDAKRKEKKTQCVSNSMK